MKSGLPYMERLSGGQNIGLGEGLVGSFPEQYNDPRCLILQKMVNVLSFMSVELLLNFGAKFQR